MKWMMLTGFVLGYFTSEGLRLLGSPWYIGIPSAVMTAIAANILFWGWYTKGTFRL